MQSVETHGCPVERIDTHAAMVFLAGERAYKIKRAVKYPYLDFSTLEKRKAACEKEVILNQRAAPDLYLDCIAVTQEKTGQLALDGSGAPVEWAVVMRRFDQEALFDRLATAGKLDPELTDQLTDVILAFHAKAPIALDSPGAKDKTTGLDWVVEESIDELGQRPDLFPAPEVSRFAAASQEALRSSRDLRQARNAAGFRRRCHGDLHLRNICLVDGRPMLFDCLEFNEALATTDVLYDLAFLLMDLEQRGLKSPANRVLNRYIFLANDIEGLRLMPLFLAQRAAIRAKVAASAQEAQSDPARRDECRKEAQRYFAAALAYLTPKSRCLMAIGGLSGSGKTTLARRLAPLLGPSPGALHLRSDVIRKQLAGVTETTRLPAKHYEPSVTKEVYRQLYEKARIGLDTGYAVMADAVFLRPSQRHAIVQTAAVLGIDFAGFWLESPASILKERVTSRRNDASDATAAVVAKQLSLDPGEISWHQMSSTLPLERQVAEVFAVLAKLGVDRQAD